MIYGRPNITEDTFPLIPPAPTMSKDKVRANPQQSFLLSPYRQQTMAKG